MGGLPRRVYMTLPCPGLVCLGVGVPISMIWLVIIGRVRFCVELLRQSGARTSPVILIGILGAAASV